jgi:hypothetical protein
MFEKACKYFSEIFIFVNNMISLGYNEYLWLLLALKEIKLFFFNKEMKRDKVYFCIILITKL